MPNKLERPILWQEVCQASVAVDSPDFFVRFGRDVDCVSQYRYLLGTTGFEIRTSANTPFTGIAKSHFLPNGSESPPDTQIERSVNGLKLVAAFLILFRDLNTPDSKLNNIQWLYGVTGNQSLVASLGIRLCAFTEIVSSQGAYCSNPVFVQEEDAREFINFSYRGSLERFKNEGLLTADKLSRILEHGLARFGDKVPIRKT